MRKSNFKIELVGDQGLFKTRISAIYSAEFDTDFKVLLCHVDQDFVLLSFQEMVNSIKNGLGASRYLKHAINTSNLVTLKIEYIQPKSDKYSDIELRRQLIKRKYEMIHELKTYIPYGLNDLKRVARYDHSEESPIAGKLITDLKIQRDHQFIQYSCSDKEKLIYRYDKKTGNFIDEFCSITEASKNVGVSISAISNCCNERIKSAGGYIWSFNEVNNIFEASPFFKVPDSRSRPIYSYDKETGEFIQSFNSMSEASRITGVLQGNISACCNGRIRTAGGYIWSYVKRPSVFPVVSNNDWAEKKRKENESKLLDKQRRFIEGHGQDYEQLVKQAINNN